MFFFCWRRERDSEPRHAQLPAKSDSALGACRGEMHLRAFAGLSSCTLTAQKNIPLADARGMFFVAEREGFEPSLGY